MPVPGALNSILTRPGVSSRTDASGRVVTLDGRTEYMPGRGVINGTESRDPNNTSFITTLRPGLILAKASGKYAPWAIGSTSGALAGDGTSVTLAAAEAVELVRRVGATGTFVLTGPPTAAGTVRQSTITYSAVNTTTGVVTVTAPGTNQVERVRFNIASTGGNLQLNVAKTDGTFATTANIAWSATDATYLASINSALDTATGVAGGIVATAISATDTDLGFTLTYSGTGYAGQAWRRAEVIVLPTTSTEAMYEPVTAAVNGAFVAGSVVSKATWSTPLTFVPENYGVVVPTDSAGTASDTESLIPVRAVIQAGQLLPYPSDTALRLWIQQQMSTTQGNKFVFDTQV
jgi:hypothetical protein